MDLNYEFLNIPPESSLIALEKILEFNYTKLQIEIESKERLEKLRLEQEYKIAQMEYEYRYKALEARPIEAQMPTRPTNLRKMGSEGPSSPRVSIEFSDADEEFNRLTGFGQLTNTSIGKISKTNITPVIKKKAHEISETISPQDVENFDKDYNTPLKLKPVLGNMMIGSIASKRLTFWSNAPDADMILTIKDEICTKLENVHFEVIIWCLDFLKEYFAKMYSGTELETLDTTLFASILDGAYEKRHLLEEAEDKYDICNSPLGKVYYDYLSFMDEYDARRLVVFFLETKPNKGTDGFSHAVTQFTENYPWPKFTQREDYDGNWKEYYEKHKQKISYMMYDDVCKMFKEHYPEHKIWLEEKEQYLANIAKK